MAAALVAVGLGGLTWTLSGPASAASPNKDGWWTQLNSGNGVPAPVPPQVPKNGLYIENGYSGPVAIAALSFDVPAGAAVGSVTLRVASSSVLTQAPVACPIAPASLGYKPEQDGEWTQRPTYDCSVAKVTATVDSGKTTVTFDAGPLLRNGEVALVVLAGGPADAVAFDQPGADALAVIPAGPPPAAGASAPSSGAASNPIGIAPASPTGPVGVTAPYTGSAVGSGGAVGASSPATGAAAGVAPAFAAPGSSAPAGRATPEASRQASPSTGHARTTSWRKDVAGWLGLAALAVALVVWTEGFGLLGGRVRQVGRDAVAPQAAAISSEA